MVEIKLSCPSCNYTTTSNCMVEYCGYCEPVICKICNTIYDVNTEFCGDPEEINKCTNCGGYDYKSWSQKKLPCPKCGSKMNKEGGDYV